MTMAETTRSTSPSTRKPARRAASVQNPANETAEALEKRFVGRHDLRDELVDSVREAALHGSGPNYLIVGPRGAGKSHLLALARHAIIKDLELRPRVAMAWLREEERGITNYIDWLVSILQAFARHEETSADPALDPGAEVEAWMDLGEADKIRKRAEQAILRFAGDRRIVLVAENLTETFSERKGFGREGQARFRDFIQNHSRWSLLASTQQLTPDLKDSDAPFYGFFNVVRLDALDLTQAKELFSNLARQHHDERVQEFLTTDAGHRRARALHFFGGGNPRLLTILYRLLHCGDHDETDSVSDGLVKLEDELTSYYQERLSSLPGLQEKILHVLAQQRGEPMPAKEVARRCFTTPGSIGKQLNLLEQRSFVHANPIGRETLYELAEPLMRVLFEAKEHTGGPTRFFVDFLAHWHTPEELENVVGSMGTGATLVHDIYRAALDSVRSAPTPSEPGDGEELPPEVRAILDSGNLDDLGPWLAKQEETPAKERGAVLLVLGCELLAGAWTRRGPTWSRWAIRILESANDAFHAMGDKEGRGMVLGNLGLAYEDLGHVQKAIEHHEQALAISRETNDRRSEGIDLGNLGLAHAALGDAPKAVEHHEQALAISRETNDRRSEGRHLGNLGLAYAALGDAHKAIKHYEQALAISRETDDRLNEGIALGNLGNEYANLGDERKAIKHYEQALAISRLTGDRRSEGLWLAGRGHLRCADEASLHAGLDDLLASLQVLPFEDGARPLVASRLANALQRAARTPRPHRLASRAEALASLTNEEEVGTIGSALLALLHPKDRPDVDRLVAVRDALVPALQEAEAWKAPARLFDAGVRHLEALDRSARSTAQKEKKQWADEAKRALVDLALEERRLVQRILEGKTEEA